jgi:hypothetical protein
MRAVTMLIVGMMVMPSYGLMGQTESARPGLLARQTEADAPRYKRGLGDDPLRAELLRRMGPTSLSPEELAELVDRQIQLGLVPRELTRAPQRPGGPDPKAPWRGQNK